MHVNTLEVDVVDLTLLALLNHNLVEEADDLQVLNDVGVLSGYKHQEKLFHWKIHVSDALSLNVCALLPYND